VTSDEAPVAVEEKALTIPCGAAAELADYVPVKLSVLEALLVDDVVVEAVIDAVTAGDAPSTHMAAAVPVPSAVAANVAVVVN